MKYPVILCCLHTHAQRPHYNFKAGRQCVAPTIMQWVLVKDNGNNKNNRETKRGGKNERTQEIRPLIAGKHFIWRMLNNLTAGMERRGYFRIPPKNLKVSMLPILASHNSCTFVCLLWKHLKHANNNCHCNMPRLSHQSCVVKHEFFNVNKHHIQSKENTFCTAEMWPFPGSYIYA